MQIKKVENIQSEIDRLEAKFEGKIKAGFPHDILTGLFMSSDHCINNYLIIIKDEKNKYIVYYDASTFAITDTGIEMYHVYHNWHKVFHNPAQVAEFIG